MVKSSEGWLRNYNECWQTTGGNILKSILKPNLKVLIAGIVLAAIGIGLYLEKTRRMDQYNWFPIEIPLQMSKGYEARASFEAELEGDYEIEIAVQNDRVSQEKIDELIRAVEKPSPLDIDWVVRHNNKTVAKGKCHDYMYLHRARFSPKSWLWKKVGLQSESPDVYKGKTASRGVGRFLGIKGERFDIEARVGKPFPELAKANPTLRVRLNRRLEFSLLASIAPLKKISKILLGLSAMAFLWFLGAILYSKLRK